MSLKIYKSHRLTQGVGLENLEGRAEVDAELAAQVVAGVGML